MSVTSVIVLGTWLEIVPVIAAMLEQHHPAAGHSQSYTVIQYCCSWPPPPTKLLCVMFTCIPHECCLSEEHSEQCAQNEQTNRYLHVKTTTKCLGGVMVTASVQ